MRLDHLLSKEASSNRVVARNVLVRLLVLLSSLFNLEGISPLGDIRGYSSAGRTPALQAGGHRFESDYLHQDGPIAQLARAHD